MDDKINNMNKNLALVLAILNIIMFGLYFTDTSRVQTYQWIITPMFAIFFTHRYITERNKNK
jgi:uncharacterized membrane protein YsdA (DUF1294 family)